MKLFGKIILVTLFVTSLFSAYNPLDGVKAQKAEALKYAKKVINVKELNNWIKDGKDFEIVDVREMKEILAGQISYKKTLNIPRGVLYGAVKKGTLKPKKVYVLVCRTGHRALLAAATLIKYYKFENVYVLKGGLKAWIQNGGIIKNGMHLGDIKVTLLK